MRFSHIFYFNLKRGENCMIIEKNSTIISEAVRVQNHLLPEKEKIGDGVQGRI